MARIREFDPLQALDKAMELFWRKGFSDTSIRDLVTHTGVAHAGLYSEFGGKESLFSAALQRYFDTVLMKLIRGLETPEAGVVDVKRFFERWATEVRKGTFRDGCFLCNSVIEFGGKTGEVRQLTESCLIRIRDGFDTALQRSKMNGDLADDLDPAEVAGFLLEMFLGAAVLLRSRIKPAQVIQGTKVALTLFD